MRRKQYFRFKRKYKIRKKKKFYKKKSFWLGIFSFFLLSGIFYLIFFSPIFQIKEIKILGAKRVSTDTLRNFIEGRANQRIFFLVTRNIFLINSQEIEKNLLAEFPQLDQAALKKKLPEILEVQVKERESAAIFCQAEFCFFVDREGVIFEKISEERDNLLRIENHLLKDQPKLGQEIFEKKEMEKILEIKEKLNQDLKISLVAISKVSEDRLDAKIFKNWKIYFNLKENISEQIFNLRLLLEEKIPQEKRENLEYIDLRFGNRVYYKFK